MGNEYRPTQYAELKNEPSFIEPGLVDERMLFSEPIRMSKKGEINLDLLNSLGTVFWESVHTPKELEKKLNETIKILEQAFNAQENTQELLGGEFSIYSHEIGINAGTNSMPLYFALDLIIKGTEARKERMSENKEMFDDIIAKLKELKEKAEKLKFDDRFKPKEKLSNGIIDELFKAGGNFRLGISKEENISHLSIDITTICDDYELRNGDIRGEGNTHSNTISTPLYESDLSKINHAKYEKEVKRYNDEMAMVENLAGKYFKDGKIPKPFDFYSSLLNRDTLDERIKIRLHSICDCLKNYNFTLQKYEFNSEITLCVQMLKDVEYQIKKERKQKKLK